jgi:hypothetical protein
VLSQLNRLKKIARRSVIASLLTILVISRMSFYGISIIYWNRSSSRQKYDFGRTLPTAEAPKLETGVQAMAA